MDELSSREAPSTARETAEVQRISKSIVLGIKWS
jgi:hypothetical protein